MARTRLTLVCCATLTLASCGGGRERATDAEPASSSHAPSGAADVPEMRFALIPSGSFDMGSDASFDMQPVHRVTISRPFEIQTTEVTQDQWRAVMGNNASQFQGGDRPVENVSWNDAQDFIARLNKLDPGKGYRLPTEAEWEYACRAGAYDAASGDLDGNAWWHRNSENQTHPVGTKRANNWGLYDMIGNVWEYTADWKGPYPAGPVTDPAGPEHGYYKVTRGGSWFDVARAANAAFRASPAPDERGNSQGFRLARGATE
jgi:formylglycine-generating enzyme required for sulfatase activity